MLSRLAIVQGFAEDDSDALGSEAFTVPGSAAGGCGSGSGGSSALVSPSTSPQKGGPGSDLYGSSTSTSDSPSRDGKSRASFELAEKWLGLLPELHAPEVPQLNAERVAEADTSPLERCLAREVLRGHSVLALVRSDLEAVR